MSVFDEKWTRVYAPKSLDDMILPSRVKDSLKEGPKQHLLFYGPPGTGKTSTALVLGQQFELPSLLINSSEETSVDVIREKISKFCSTFSIMEGPGRRKKLPILDEVDGVSDQFNKALKAAMEKFEKTSYFIATTNHINKIPEAVKSRFKLVNFDFIDDEANEVLRGYIKRIHEIGKEQGLTFDKDALVEFVKRKFPDMRSMLNALQGYYDEGKRHLTIDDVKKFSGVYRDIFELVFTNVDPVKNYQYLVSEYSSRVDDVLASLGNEFIEYIQMERVKYATKIPEIIITVAEHQAQRVHVIDPVVTMLSCIYRLQSIVNNA